MLNRGRLWLLTIAGGAIFVLQGCDTTVRDDVLTGVGSAAETLATTFIGAFFQSLINQGDESATVVKAVTEMMPQIFC